MSMDIPGNLHTHFTNNINCSIFSTFIWNTTNNCSAKLQEFLWRYFDFLKVKVKSSWGSQSDAHSHTGIQSYTLTLWLPHYLTNGDTDSIFVVKVIVIVIVIRIVMLMLLLLVLLMLMLIVIVTKWYLHWCTYWYW